MMNLPFVSDVPKARFITNYEVFNSKGESLNTGSTTLGFLRKDNMRPCRAPQWFVDLLIANGLESDN